MYIKNTFNKNTHKQMYIKCIKTLAEGCGWENEDEVKMRRALSGLITIY